MLSQEFEIEEDILILRINHLLICFEFGMVEKVRLTATERLNVNPLGIVSNLMEVISRSIPNQTAGYSIPKPGLTPHGWGIDNFAKDQEWMENPEETPALTRNQGIEEKINQTMFALSK